MYCCFSFVYIKTIFESTEMRILQTIVILSLIAWRINDKLDELTGEKYLKNPNDKNE